MKNRITILIPGHDDYIDIVNLYLWGKKKFWNDCPYDTIWTNCGSILNLEGCSIICNDANASFCSRLYNALRKIKTKYVLLNIEDFLYSKKINTKDVENLLDLMDKNKYNFCALLPNKDMRGYKNGTNGIFISDYNKPYGLCLNIGIFNREYLLDLISDLSWTGWDLENKMLKMANNNELNGCIYNNNDIFGIFHLIYKGKIVPKSKKSLELKGYDFHDISRPSMTRKEILNRTIIGGVGKICPKVFRKTIKKLLNKVGVSTVTKY